MHRFHVGVHGNAQKSHVLKYPTPCPYAPRASKSFYSKVLNYSTLYSLYCCLLCSFSMFTFLLNSWWPPTNDPDLSLGLFLTRSPWNPATKLQWFHILLTPRNTTGRQDDQTKTARVTQNDVPRPPQSPQRYVPNKQTHTHTHRQSLIIRILKIVIIQKNTQTTNTNNRFKNTTNC